MPLKLINNKHNCEQKFVLSTWENAIGTPKYTFIEIVHGTSPIRQIYCTIFGRLDEPESLVIWI